MKILLWSAPPWARTGYGVGTKHLAKLLLGQGHQVAISPMTRLPVDMEWEGIMVMPNADPDIGKAGVVENFRRWRADLLIVWFEAWLLGDFLIQAGLSHATVIYSAVDHQPLSPRTRRAVMGALAVVPYCEFAQRAYQEAGVECRSPISHGVDTSVFRPLGNRGELRRLLGLPETAFVFGINATNSGPRKNIPGMMRSFRRFLQSHPTAQRDCYLLVHTYPVADGNNPDGYDLHQVWEALGGPLENLRCATPERYLQGLTDEGMAQWYNAIDVLLSCSMGEGFGFPLLEAAACGVPAIVTDFSSMPELVTNRRGWLVPVADLVPMQNLSSYMAVPSTSGMVHDISQAYRDRKKVKRLGEAALGFAKTLEWSSVAGKWRSLLQELAQVDKKRPINWEGIAPWRLGLIPEALPEGAPRRVLDIGCGLSQPYRRHLERLGEYLAVDLRGGDGIVQADMRALPFRDGEFGFLWASEVLEHLDGGWERAVAEARRVAKHGVIIFPLASATGFSYDPSHREVKGVEFTPIAARHGLITW